MNEQYEKSIYRIGGRLIESHAMTVHNTQAEAEWATIQHYAKTEGKYAYRITRLVMTETETGWQRVGATHIFNGRKVSEGEWTNAVRGLKS